MMRRIVASGLLLVIILMCCVSCGSKKPEVILDGGVLAESRMEDMETVVSSIPTKDGHAFVGWYSDAAFTNRVTAESLTKDVKKDGVIYAKWARVDTFTYPVRSEQTTVNSTGKQNQIVDVVYVSDDINLSDFKQAGYQALEITVTMEVPLSAQTAKTVYLYKNSNVVVPEKSVIGWLDQALFGPDEDKNMISSHKVDVVKSEGATKEGDTAEWGVVTFTTRVELGNLERDLYLRYDAEKNTQWTNRNVLVKVTPKK